MCFGVGLFPAVFASRYPSFACGGLWRVVGVLVWGVWFWGVGGLAGGVAGFTLVRLALGRGIYIMEGARFKGKPAKGGGAGKRLGGAQENE